VVLVQVQVQMVLVQMAVLQEQMTWQAQVVLVQVPLLQVQVQVMNLIRLVVWLFSSPVEASWWL
jgi:hypothetical protein